jgi:4-amino-4-deoxy-L-arabinose transferase-like glycosyltransferase
MDGLCCIAAAGLSAIGIFATVHSRLVPSVAISVWTAIPIVAVLFVLVVWSRATIRSWTNRIAYRILATPGPQWLAVVVSIGIALRLLAFVAGDIDQTRDKLAYWSMAQLIAAGEPIIIDTYLGMAKALYPPGMGFLLAPLVAAFGPNPWALAGFNGILFVLTVIITAKVCKALCLPATARLAPMIIALWPNHIAGTVMATKELALGILIPVIFLLVLAAARRGMRWQWRSVAAGGLLGAAALIQPAMAPLGLSVAYWDWIVGRNLRLTILRSAIVAVVSFAVIAPWTMRNYHVFGKFVPFTTAGGMSFFLANNDHASGRFIAMERYFPDWKDYPEPQWDAEAAMRARHWIASHPIEFLRLVPRRQMAYLCCSNDNIFDWVWLGLSIRDWRYFAANAAAGIAWIAILLAIFLAAITAAKHGAIRGALTPDSKLHSYKLLVPPILVSLALHSTGESGARFGFTFFVFWSILAGMLAEWGPKTMPPSGRQKPM